MSTLILLLRHGQTACTVRALFCGRCNEVLNERGVLMATAAGRALAHRGVRRVLSSPSPRSQQTAHVLAEQVGLRSIETDPRLRETAFGDWEGLPVGAVSGTDAYRRWVADPVLHAPPGGESGAEVLARMLGCLAATARSSAPGPVAVVSHKGPIRLALAHGLGVPLARYRTDVPAPVGSIATLRLADRLAVESTAVVGHLPVTMRADPDHAA
jgi:broad specificity phosphatase PhoE